MVNINIQKKDPLFLVVILVFLVGISFVIAYSYINPIPNPGHGGDNVSIFVNGVSKDLQQAIDDGDFSSLFTGGTSSGGITKGHKGKEIIVNTGGNIKSFQEAINDGSLSSVVAGTSPSDFGSIVHGNNGDEILININSQEKTLQQAINDGDFTQKMYISIGMSSRQVFRNWHTVTAAIRVTLDSSTGQPISGAIVEGTWSGGWSGTVSGTTNSNGQVGFTTPWIGGGSTVIFTVDSISIDGINQNLDGTLSSSIYVS